MSHPLAILAPQIGLRSETFLHRHMADLLPGQTVVIARPEGNERPAWSVNAPIWQIGTTTFTDRMVQRLRRRSRDQLNADLVTRFLKRHGTRVVLGEYLNFCLPWIRPIRDAGIRFFAHGHGFDVSARLREPACMDEYRRFLPEADGIIVVSDLHRRRLLDLGLDAPKVHVVPCGTPIPDSLPERPAGAVLRCLAVGRMVAKKAPILLLDAFRRAAELVPELRLDMVGTGELFASAQQFVHAMDLSDRVTLHGGQAHERVVELMRDADLFLQHSVVDPITGDEEGLPVSLLEAMANGLPVVSTRHAGIPEAVEEGVSGYLVDEGDSVAMAECIVGLARDPDLRRSMGQAGWARCREQFSWERERTELLRILGLEV